MKIKATDYLFSNFLVRDSFFNEISVTSMFEGDNSLDKFDIDFETVFFQNQSDVVLDSDFFSMNQSTVFDRREIVRPSVSPQFYQIEIRDRFESTKIKKASSVVQSGFFSFSFYPDVGDIVYVAYFDYDLSERFMLGRCVYVFKNNIFSYFSLYQKSYGFFITFYINSPCFIGFCVVSLPHTTFSMLLSKCEV
jgi:hypothetical protein